jgi:hypothetical protein
MHQESKDGAERHILQLLGIVTLAVVPLVLLVLKNVQLDDWHTVGREHFAGFLAVSTDCYGTSHEQGSAQAAVSQPHLEEHGDDNPYSSKPTSVDQPVP